MVPFDAIGGLAESAAGFDKGAGFGDANGLDERLLYRLFARDEDGVHGVIRHALADELVVHDNRNVHLLQVRLGPNAAEK